MRQFVVIETRTVGASAPLAVGGLVLLGRGEAVTESVSTTAVSVPVAVGVDVSVLSSVLV